MSPPLLFEMPGNEALAEALFRHLEVQRGVLNVRRFPDGESAARLLSDPRGRHVVFLATLDRPDPKLVPLVLAMETARDLGAASVGLVAPYLCYMRQDRRFHPGEAVSARIVAGLLSRSIDWLVTVDPHLHRIHEISEIYPVPSTVVHAAPAIADWVCANVQRPLFIGPDAESAQWVEDVARRADAPHVVLEKVRRGDRDVQVSVPDVERWRDHSPVLVDDIISTGRTLVETLRHLRRAGMRPSTCVGVHALFSGDALRALIAADAADIVTCNTIVHETNGIDLSVYIAGAIRAHLPASSAGEAP